MKFRKSNWFDTENLVEKYGIQVKHPISGRWCYCFEGSKPLIYDTIEERNNKIKELQETIDEVK